MKKVISILLLLALAAGGFWAWNIYRSDERRIVRQLNSLKEILRWAPNDGNFARLGRANSLKEMLAPDVVVEVETARNEMRAVSGRDEIYRGFIGAQTQIPAGRVDLPSISVEMEGPTNASARMTTFLYIGSENREPFLQEIALELIKSDDRWLIQKVQTIRTLRE